MPEPTVTPGPEHTPTFAEPFDPRTLNRSDRDIDPKFDLALPQFNRPRTYVPQGYVTLSLNLLPHLSITERIDCTEDTVVEAIDTLCACVRARLLAAS